MELISKIKEAVSDIEAKGITQPEVGIVLGTGLGSLAAHIEDSIVIDYSEIPHFPLSTVESHSGKLHFGMLGGKRVIALQGRFHSYEGYDMKTVSFPIRVFQHLGIDALFLSGAAGTMNLDWEKGDLMMINDHINLQPTNPLIGPNDDRLGTRFPDMSEAYDQQFQEILRDNASSRGVVLREGVYVSVPGPMLETAAEYRYLRKIGADAVGMSTVPEVIVARHAGIRCAAVVVLTDRCDPDALEPINIEEIIQIASEAETKLINVVLSFISAL